MTSIEGIRFDGLPNNVPQVRAKMPGKYQRPGISVGGGAIERREWRTVMAADLKVGDIVPGVGLLAAVKEEFTCPPTRATVEEPVTWTATVTGGEGNTKVYQGGEPVLAFTAAKGRSDDSE